MHTEHNNSYYVVVMSSCRFLKNDAGVNEDDP